MSIAQHELNKQLTAIVPIQFIYQTIVTIPFFISTILGDDAMLENDSLVAVKILLYSAITVCIYYFNYAVSRIC
jgi:hypothetical protein